LKNFCRHPFYRPISDIWAISDVVVLPSEFEGMPMVIIEAQAMGKPVVVTDVGNNLDVVNLTKGGVVVSQIGDVTALAEGVHKMLVNPPDPERVRQATLSHFDISIVAQKYRDAFLGVGNA
jgi:glycosyltransferase involved in cell wall biosynthesis